MLTAVDSKPYNSQLNHIPQMQDPNISTNLPEINKLQHFDGYKTQFPLTSNHSGSMPILPTRDQPMNYNPIPNSRQDRQVPQQQANVYPSLSRYSQNNTILNPTPQNIPPSINIPAVEKTPPFASTESTMVTFVDLKTFYEKGQCRLQGKSEQRLDYASSFVRIYLENPNNIQVEYYYTTPLYHTIAYEPYPTISYYTIPYYTTPNHTKTCHTIPYHNTPYHTLPHHTIHHTILPFTIQYHTIQYHPI
jgi:hypothetical protein